MVEPWRCNTCNLLVYNLDDNGYPTEGAPMGHYADIDHQNVCSVCYFMITNPALADSNYWRGIRAAEYDKRIKDKRLKPGSDYFTGAQ